MCKNEHEIVSEISLKIKNYLPFLGGFTLGFASWVTAYLVEVVAEFSLPVPVSSLVLPLQGSS